MTPTSPPPPAVHPLALALRQCQQAQAAAEQALASLQATLTETQQALHECQAREAAARHQASHDGLTGLANRLSFGAQARQLLAQQGAQGLAVLFIDLDDFKLVNDHLGHAVGDALLQLVGARLAHAVRGEDLVGRQGGDEFVCLLPQVRRSADALAIARKLVAAVAAPCVLGGLTLRVHASVGVAIYPQHGLSLPALLDQADRAMLRAKASPGCGPALARTPRLAPAAARQRLTPDPHPAPPA